MRISDWSSDVCSSDLHRGRTKHAARVGATRCFRPKPPALAFRAPPRHIRAGSRADGRVANPVRRSEEHTSELQSLMRISYAVFCLNKKNTHTIDQSISDHTRARTHVTTHDHNN